MFDFTFGQELEQKLVEKSKMNPVTKVNGEPPFKEPKLIVLTLEEAEALLVMTNLVKRLCRELGQRRLDLATELENNLIEKIVKSSKVIEREEKDNASN